MKKRITALAAFIFASALISAQSKKLVVTGISATSPSQNKITVTWNIPETTDGTFINQFIVYRDTKPITTYDQIENLEPLRILPQGSASFNDTIYDTKEFFYAVLSVTASGDPASGGDLYYDEELDKKEGSSSINTLKIVLPGVNATVNGVKAVFKKKSQIRIQKQETSKKEYNNTLREKPLPYIDILGDDESHEKTISDSTYAKVADLIKTSESPAKQPLEPHIFEEDLISPAGGDDYLLFEILKTSFIKKNYAGSIRSLKKFLAQNRTKNVQDRAIFYLGECYYYTGQFAPALTYFLTLEETYPVLSRKWTESTLDLFDPSEK